MEVKCDQIVLFLKIFGKTMVARKTQTQTLWAIVKNDTFKANCVPTFGEI